MSDDWGSRETLLKPGARVRARKDSAGPRSSFATGERLTFESASYSRYDSSWFFAFRDAAGRLKSWLLPDDLPAASLHDHFESDA